MFAVAVVALVAFIIRERRITFPMLDLSLFESHTYAFSVAAATLQSLAIFAVNFLLIFYLQGVRGYNPLITALLILPMPVVSSIIGPLSGRWADRIGGTIPATLGLLAQALALVALVTLSPTTPYIVLALALVLMGLGSGLFWSPNTSTTMGAAPRNRLGIASATLNTMRNVGMVFSFAVALAVAAASMPPAIMNKVFLGTVGHLAPNISADFTGGMDHAFLVSAAICLLAMLFSFVREGRRHPSQPQSQPEERDVTAQPVGSPQP